VRWVLFLLLPIVLIAGAYWYAISAGSALPSGFPFVCQKSPPLPEVLGARQRVIGDVVGLGEQIDQHVAEEMAGGHAPA
jgi:hypothetical protein